MDRTCIDCGVPISYRSMRCKTHSAFERWRIRIAPRFCKSCAKQIRSRSKARATYCSIACKYADPDLRTKIGSPRRQTEKTCPGCGETFAKAVSVAHRFTYCSRECSRTRGADEVCRRCGAMFRHGKANPRAHCSEVCRRPPVLVTCDHCSGEFRTIPSRAGQRRYCSSRCYMASGRETSIERVVRLFLESARYRVHPQAQIGPWVVDFLVGRLVIEADGSYWHSLRPDVDRRKNADLTSRGYVVWRLPEVEIRDLQFAETFERRLADHEAAHGQLPRLAPDEPTLFGGEYRVVGGYTQLALALKS